MNQPPEPATLGILIAAGAVSLLGFGHRSIMDALIFNPYRILQRHQYHRLITSGFLHADLSHLLFNGLSLYWFGNSLEKDYGLPLLLTVFFSSMIGGNLLSLLLHWNQRDYLALGASGGVCGVIFASIFLIASGSIYILPIPVAIPMPVYAVLFVLISVFGISAGKDNIGHDAHLGGAIVGLLVTTGFHPEIVEKKPQLYAIIMVLSLAAFLFLAFWSRRRPEHRNH